MKCDCLRPIEFHANLKYIHVKFTVSILVYTSWFIKQQGCAAHLG